MTEPTPVDPLAPLDPYVLHLSWIFDDTAPSDGIGVPRDCYLNTATGDVYQKADDNTWGSPAGTFGSALVAELAQAAAEAAQAAAEAAQAAAEAAIGDAEAAASAAADSASEAAASAASAQLLSDRSPFVGPLVTVDGYDLEFALVDGDGAVMFAVSRDNVFLSVVGGVLAPPGSGGEPFEGPLVEVNGYFLRSATVDSTGAVNKAIDINYTELKYAHGGLVRVDGHVFQGPLVESNGYMLREAHIGGDGAVYGAIDMVGIMLTLDAGFLVPVGSGGGHETPALLYDAPSGLWMPDDNDEVLDIFFVWGQSLAEGSNPIEGDVTFTDTALDPGYSLMLEAGAFPDTDTSAAFSDLREGNGSAGSIETIGSRMFHAMQTEWNAALGRKRKMLWFAAALGGRPYYQIKKGTPVWDQIVQHLDEAKTIASGLGLTCRLVGVVWMHGEQDLKDANMHAYARFMIESRRDVDDLAREMFGQTNIVRMFVSQGNLKAYLDNEIPNTPVAQLLAPDLDPYTYCVGPKYYFAQNGGGVHPTAEGYAMIGETIGHAVIQSLYGIGWYPVRTDEVWWSATDSTPELTIRYRQPIKIDTSDDWVNDSDLDAHGFLFEDGTGSPPTITSVTATASAVTSHIVVTGVASVTLGDSASDYGQTMGGTRSFVVEIVADGVKYGVWAKPSEWQVSDILANLSAQIAGSSVADNVITMPGGLSTLTATAYSDEIVLTLSAIPTGKRQKLSYATKETGAGGSGRTTGARGTVRFPISWGRSAISGTPELADWACAEVIVLPPL